MQSSRKAPEGSVTKNNRKKNNKKKQSKAERPRALQPACMYEENSQDKVQFTTILRLSRGTNNCSQMLQTICCGIEELQRTLGGVSEHLSRFAISKADTKQPHGAIYVISHRTGKLAAVFQAAYITTAIRYQYQIYLANCLLFLKQTTAFFEQTGRTIPEFHKAQRHTYSCVLSTMSRNALKCSLAS